MLSHFAVKQSGFASVAGSAPTTAQRLRLPESQ
jgi:hypothetical protein